MSVLHLFQLPSASVGIGICCIYSFFCSALALVVWALRSLMPSIVCTSSLVANTSMLLSDPQAHLTPHNLNQVLHVTFIYSWMHMTCNLLQSYLELAVATTRTVTWICYVCIHTYICTYVEATSRSRDNNDELRRPGQYVEVWKHRVIYVRNILIIKSFWFQWCTVV